MTHRVSPPQRILSCLLLCLLLTNIVAQRSRGRFRINCEKYVYAPRCRGIAAKRALEQQSTKSTDVTEMEDDNLKNFRSHQRNPFRSFSSALNSNDLLKLLSRGLLTSQYRPQEVQSWPETSKSTGDDEEIISWTGTDQDLGAM